MSEGASLGERLVEEARYSRQQAARLIDLTCQRDRLLRLMQDVDTVMDTAAQLGVAEVLGRGSPCAEAWATTHLAVQAVIAEVEAQGEGRDAS